MRSSGAISRTSITPARAPRQGLFEKTVECEYRDAGDSHSGEHCRRLSTPVARAAVIGQIAVARSFTQVGDRRDLGSMPSAVLLANVTAPADRHKDIAVPGLP